MKTKIYILITLFALFAITACDKDFEEMNKDPFNPTETSLPPVFNSMTATLVKGWHEQTAFEYELSAFACQITNIYGTSGYLPAETAGELWTGYYKFRSDAALYDKLIEEYDKDLNLANLIAQKDVINAYKTFKLIDIFGDIPYYDAAKATEGPDYFYPKYDDAKTIYMDMIGLLKSADASLVETPGDDYAKLGSYDVLFKDDILMWRKFANSIRLRQALRAYDADNSLSGEVADILDNNLPLIEDGEVVEMDPVSLDLDLRGRIWAYGNGKVRFGRTMFDAMADATTEAGIFDPRLRLFSEVNSDGVWNPMPYGVSVEEKTGNPNAENRWQDDANAGEYTYSPINYWMLTGRYSVPELVMSATEVHFLKAEAYAKGVGVAVNMAKAQEEYEAGIRSSIDYWFGVAEFSRDFGDNYSWRDVPARPTDAEIDAMLANPKVAWNDANALGLIYNQHWLSHIRQPLQAWSLYRQTKMTPQSGGLEFVFNRLTYPSSELDNNADNYADQVSKMGADDFIVKVWWAK